MALELNVKAPDVTLSSNKGDAVKLSEQWEKGPVVLAFFPMAFTGVCTEEMCEFRDSVADFSGHKAQGINKRTPPQHQITGSQHYNVLCIHGRCTLVKSVVN